MSEIDPFASATEHLVALRTCQITSVELLDLYLDRIERYNPVLNAVVTFDIDRARENARRADECRRHGDTAALLGLPITIKDAIDVEGLPTTGGIQRRREHRAASDAPVVARLRAAGAVILGKTNVPPYAGSWQTNSPIFGRSNNPWDLDRTPGGSTGGGAAALAAGLTSLEFGSDIGGSVRVPAAFCGLYGHRSSETAVPRSGHWPGATTPNPAGTLNVIGPLARSAGDLALALDIVAGAEVGEDAGWRLVLPPARHDRLTDFRVAILPPIPWLPVQEQIVSALASLVERLRQLGVTVEEAQPEALVDMPAYHRDYRRLMGLMFSFNAERDLERRQRQAEGARDSEDEFTRAWAEGLLMSAHDLLALFARREAYRASFRQFFQRWDVLLSPVAPLVAFTHAEGAGEESLTVNGTTMPYDYMSVYPGVATLSGQPCTAFPAGKSEAGLPIGLQATGPYLEDHTSIEFARLLASHYGRFEPPPGFP